ncbi:predicted protein [Naegleria gruberi]|uniref:Predicted protein n=1 Tax=Naegleria gruberi TaxID=5762 RepID=D2W2M1_NAEGR|nr:uncharacterized protein NAEGRDRAFT_75638 [Naegleria gruberi]EFC36640.1 predicted protein [Naegleria gruberi]|eukprot:XP_002669384.1 predicted protein [Naegleria gruberi strain NEG-M]
MTEPAAKKMKITPQQEHSINSIPDDVFSHKIFPFLSGNDLFNNQRLVCSSWNNRVLATRCSIRVCLTDEESIRKFIASAEGGLFKNVVGLVLRAEGFGSTSFEKIVNLDWPCLTALDVSDNDIGSAGIEQLSKGNIKGLTSLKIFNNNIGEEGAKFVLSGNLSGLTTLNYQSVARKGQDKFFAMTDHFCGDTPFTVHSFDNSDEFTEYIFKYYLDYWKHYGSDSLDLDDYEQEDDEEPNEPILREKVYALTFGKIADMAVNEVGGMVFNECERESIVATIYGQELTAELLSNSDESTPFVMDIKSSCNHETIQIIGKSKFLKHVAEYLGGEDEDEDEQSDEKLFERISQKIGENIASDDGDECLVAVCIGEVINCEFVLLK